MTRQYVIIRCVAMKQDGKPIDPCSTCARSFNVKPCGIGAPWMTIPPAFWNGTCYVCEHHIELQPSSQTTTN